MSKKKVIYRATTDINTDPHTNPGDVLDLSLVNKEALAIFIKLGHVIEETDTATGDKENGEESNP